MRNWEKKKACQILQFQILNFSISHYVYFSVLNSRWKEKSQLIGQLEKQVQEMKESWEKKEVKLTQERDKALNAAKYVRTNDRFFEVHYLKTRTFVMHQCETSNLGSRKRFHFNKE